MAATTMDAKMKKDKSSKKRKASETLEAPQPPNPTESSPLPTSEPRTQSEIEKKRSSRTSRKVQSSNEMAEEPPPKKRKSSLEEIEVDITKPEPPSKKALRQLKKGKPLPPPKSGANSSPEPEEEKPKKPEIEKRSEHGIWIGNLPWSVTKADLRTFLTSDGDITDETITRIHMPSPDDGKPSNGVEESKPWKKQHNKGFAYVDFSAPDAVHQAVAFSERLLSGRRVLIKDNKSFEGRPQKTKEESRSGGKPPNRRVFLGNLRFDTTEDSLKMHFEHCGLIESVMVATFEDSGKCKGYGWITFEELDAAQSAVRGFALVPHERDEDGESDAVSEDGKGSDDEEDEGMNIVKTRRPKQLSMTKIWVDKIGMRPVRREFAEDTQVRYKKRYGKDGTKGKAGSGTAAAAVREEGITAGEGEVERTAKKRPLRKVEYQTPYAPRLTGGIVESKGKKLVF